MRSALEEARALDEILYKHWCAAVADVCVGDIAIILFYPVEAVCVPVGGVLFAGFGADGLVAEGTYIDTQEGLAKWRGLCYYVYGNLIMDM